MTTAHPIIVCADIDSSTPRVLSAAARLRHGDPVVIVHVMPDLDFVAPLFPQDTSSTLVDRASLENAVRTHLQEAAKTAGLGDAELLVLHGEPHVRIHGLVEERGARLVVMAPTAAEQGSLGMTEKIVRHAGVAVWVARDLESKGPIFVATDLSDASLAALHVGDAEARARGVPLVVAHIVDNASWASFWAATAASLMGRPAPTMDANPQVEAARATLATLVAEHAPGALCVVDSGRPVDTLLQHAKAHDAALIVVGTHGRTGFDRALVGSVAESVVTRATCSVLVVR